MDGINLAFIFAIGISFLPASLVTFIVKEREINVKHQQIVSGVSLNAYWAANYFVDFAKYLIPAILCCLVALIMNASVLVDDGHYGVLWILFILYGFSIVSFVYLLSFAFKDYGSGQMSTFFLNFCLGFIGGLAMNLLRFFESTRSIAKVLSWVLRLCPTFSITHGMLTMTNKKAYARIENFDENLSPFNMKLVGPEIVMMIITAIVFYLLVFVLEAMRTKKNPFSKDVHSDP